MSSGHFDIIRSQQAFFQTGATRSVSFRKEQLNKLQKLIEKNEKHIEQALHADLRKHPQEVFITELGPSYEEIKVQRKNFQRWMKPRRVSTPIFLQPSVSKIYPEPVGNTIIITPWNYPLVLTVRPLAGAIAAGNTILIKQSEHSVKTSALIEELINNEFPPEYIHAIPGIGSDVLPSILEEFHFGRVFFTGSTFVGSKIMEMAAKQLSPVSLELGGKSPCIIDKTANLSLAAKRIVWGKMLNCGQSCVAPDYLLVHPEVKEKIIQLIISEIEKNYGKEILYNNDYGRIIHEGRYRKLLTYLDEGNIIYGGQTNDAERFISPTIMDDIKPNATLLKEEIFGPILPVFTYKSNEHILEIIAENPYPLSVYVFSNDRSMQDLILNNVPFGGGCINEAIYHLGNHHMPFSGIGTSGMGGHLGKHSFDLFTHYKGIVKKANLPDPPFRFPPFTEKKAKLWRRIVHRKWFNFFY
jgi:aldehyde dehydrogenase (NAD+)